MSEVGAWGYQCPDDHGLHLLESEFIAEVLSVESGEPVAEGETGELILTNLGRWAMPAGRVCFAALVCSGSELLAPGGGPRGGEPTS